MSNEVLSKAVLGAGLIPVQSEVTLENYLLDVLQPLPTGRGYSIQEPLPTRQLMPWLSQAPEAGVSRSTPGLPNSAGRSAPVELQPQWSLLYFWFPGCENCAEGLRTLDGLSRSPKFPPNLQLILVAYDTNVTQAVAQEAGDLGLRSIIYLDPEAAVAERLAVLGSPATFLVDDRGRVQARLNGEVDFDTPGFDILLARIAESSRSQTLSEVKSLPGVSVRILGVPATGWIFIGILILVCYSITKSIARYRRDALRDQK